MLDILYEMAVDVDRAKRMQQHKIYADEIHNKLLSLQDRVTDLIDTAEMACESGITSYSDYMWFYIANGKAKDFPRDRGFFFVMNSNAKGYFIYGVAVHAKGTILYYTRDGYKEQYSRGTQDEALFVKAFEELEEQFYDYVDDI